MVDTDLSGSLSGKRVVICEDAGIMQLTLSKMLARAGILVVGNAVNGPQAVALTLQEHPDIVIMDINMPGIDGLEAARRILEVYPVCIVMVTAYDLDEYKEQAQAIGVTAYLIKPLTHEILLPQLLEAWNAFQARHAQRQSPQ